MRLERKSLSRRGRSGSAPMFSVAAATLPARINAFTSAWARPQTSTKSKSSGPMERRKRSKSSRSIGSLPWWKAKESWSREAIANQPEPLCSTDDTALWLVYGFVRLHPCRSQQPYPYLCVVIAIQRVLERRIASRIPLRLSARRRLQRSVQGVLSMRFPGSAASLAIATAARRELLASGWHGALPRFGEESHRRFCRPPAETKV